LHFQEQRGRECPRNRHEESLLLSGHSERHEIDEIQSSNAPFLSKPFTPVELSVAIEKALQDRD